MKKFLSLFVCLILLLLCAGSAYYTTAIISLTIVGPVADDLTTQQTVLVWLENIYYWTILFALGVFSILHTINAFKKIFITFKIEKIAAILLFLLLAVGTVVFSFVNGIFFLIVLPVVLPALLFYLTVKIQELRQKKEDYEGII